MSVQEFTFYYVVSGILCTMLFYNRNQRGVDEVAKEEMPDHWHVLVVLILLASVLVWPLGCAMYIWNAGGRHGGRR